MSSGRRRRKRSTTQRAPASCLAARGSAPLRVASRGSSSPRTPARCRGKGFTLRTISYRSHRRPVLHTSAARQNALPRLFRTPVTHRRKKQTNKHIIVVHYYMRRVEFDRFAVLRYVQCTSFSVIILFYFIFPIWSSG